MQKTAITHFARSGKLHPAPPFDFHKTLRYLRIFLPGKAEYFCGEDHLVKPLYLEGQTVLFRLKSWGSIDRPLLSYILVSEEPISESLKYRALERISFSLGIYDNLSTFYQKAISDHRFYPIIKRLYGYHQVKYFSPFENICRAMLGRESRSKGWRLKHLLIRSYGSLIAVNGIRFHTFPSPSQLAFSSINQLTVLLGERSLAETLLLLARAFQETREDFLRAAPYPEAFHWLVSLPGVTPAIASSVLLHSLGRLETTPAADKHLLHALARCYPDMEPNHLPMIMARYGQWQGYWAHYLSLAA